MTTDTEAKALLLDAEVMTLTVLSGLLTNWWECEIALLRGREHPTRDGIRKDVERPTGSELIDLFAEAVVEIRGSEATCEAVLRDGLIPTIMEGKYVMVDQQGELLRKYLKHATKNDIL